IGLLGAKIWKENAVDFANPVNLVPISAGIIIAIGDVTLNVTDTFSLGGIALGSIVAIAGFHLARWLAPESMKEPLDGARAYHGGAALSLGKVETPEGVVDPHREDGPRR